MYSDLLSVVTASTTLIMVDPKDVMLMSETELGRRGSVPKQVLIQALLETRKQVERLTNVSKSVPAGEEDIVSRIDLLLAKRLDPLKDSLMALTNKLETLEDKFNELKKEHEKISQFGSERMEDVYEEVHRRIMRRKYLIVSGIPEQATGTVEEREEADEAAIEALGRAIGVPEIDPDDVRRIGKINQGRPRLLRFKCSSITTRNSLLRSSKNLKRHQEYVNTYINPDQTLLQRKQSKELRMELKRRRDSGEDVVIRRGRIVLKSDLQNFQTGF